MLTPHTIREFVNAQPFRPFQIHMASGRTFEVRHPEMIKILRSGFLVFSTVSDEPDFPDQFESASLMLAESISPLETKVAQTS